MGLLGWRGHFPVSESMETVQRDGLRAECARPRRVSVLCRPRKVRGSVSWSPGPASVLRKGTGAVAHLWEPRGVGLGAWPRRRHWGSGGLFRNGWGLAGWSEARVQGSLGV